MAKVGVRCLHYLLGAMLARLHTRVCNFVRNISTNISALGQGTHPKLGELSCLFIVYYMTIRCIAFFIA